MSYGINYLSTKARLKRVEDFLGREYRRGQITENKKYRPLIVKQLKEIVNFDPVFLAAHWKIEEAWISKVINDLWVRWSLVALKKEIGKAKLSDSLKKKLLAKIDNRINFITKPTEKLWEIFSAKNSKRKNAKVILRKVGPLKTKRGTPKKRTEPDGSPYNIFDVLTVKYNGAFVDAGSIREETIGRMPDGHLSSETVLRDLGTLIYLGLVEKQLSNEGSLYRAADLSPPKREKVLSVLKGLGARPASAEKDDAREEILAILALRGVPSDREALRGESLFEELLKLQAVTGDLLDLKWNEDMTKEDLVEFVETLSGIKELGMPEKQYYFNLLVLSVLVSTLKRSYAAVSGPRVLKPLRDLVLLDADTKEKEDHARNFSTEISVYEDPGKLVPKMLDILYEMRGSFYGTGAEGDMAFINDLIDSVSYLYRHEVRTDTPGAFWANMGNMTRTAGEREDTLLPLSREEGIRSAKEKLRAVNFNADDHYFILGDIDRLSRRNRIYSKGVIGILEEPVDPDVIFSKHSLFKEMLETLAKEFSIQEMEVYRYLSGDEFMPVGGSIKVGNLEGKLNYIREKFNTSFKGKYAVAEAGDLTPREQMLLYYNPDVLSVVRYGNGYHVLVKRNEKPFDLYLRMLNENFGNTLVPLDFNEGNMPAVTVSMGAVSAKSLIEKLEGTDGAALLDADGFIKDEETLERIYSLGMILADDALRKAKKTRNAVYIAQDIGSFEGKDLRTKLVKLGSGEKEEGIDTLTGFYEEDKFRDRIGETLMAFEITSYTGELSREKGGFHALNAALGHDDANLVITVLAEEIEKAFKSSDITKAVFGRSPPDRFLISLEDRIDQDRFINVLTDILINVKRRSEERLKELFGGRYNFDLKLKISVSTSGDAGSSSAYEFNNIFRRIDITSRLEKLIEMTSSIKIEDAVKERAVADYGDMRIFSPAKEETLYKAYRLIQEKEKQEAIKVQRNEIREKAERVAIAIRTFDHGPATDPGARLVDAFMAFKDGDLGGLMPDETRAKIEKCKKLEKDVKDLYFKVREITLIKQDDPDEINEWRGTLEKLTGEADELYETANSFMEACKLGSGRSSLGENALGEKRLPDLERMVKHLHLAKEILNNRLRFADGRTSEEKIGIKKLVEDAARWNTGRYPDEAMLYGVGMRSVPEKEMYISGDRLSLLNAVANIVRNAWSSAGKYSGQKDMRVDIDIEEDGDWVAIKIEDNGGGVASDFLKIGPNGRPAIYDINVTTKETGTGLGLAEAWYVLKDHGARIDIHSEEGKGSVFTIKIPKDKDGSTLAGKTETPPAEKSAAPGEEPYGEEYLDAWKDPADRVRNEESTFGRARRLNSPEYRSEMKVTCPEASYNYLLYVAGQYVWDHPKNALIVIGLKINSKRVGLDGETKEKIFELYKDLETELYSFKGSLPEYSRLNYDYPPARDTVTEILALKEKHLKLIAHTREEFKKIIPAEKYPETRVMHDYLLFFETKAREFFNDLEKAVRDIEREEAGIKQDGKAAKEVQRLFDQLVARAYEAKRKNEGVIVGIDTSWIPDMQRAAIQGLVNELTKLSEKKGLNNIIIVRGNAEGLASEVSSKMDELSRDTNKFMKIPLSNIVLLGKEGIFDGSAFDWLRPGDDASKWAFFAEVSRLESFPETGDVRLLRMIEIALRLAFDGDTIINDPFILVSEGETARNFIFIPTAGKLELEVLKARYNAETEKIASAV